MVKLFELGIIALFAFASINTNAADEILESCVRGAARAEAFLSSKNLNKTREIIRACSKKLENKSLYESYDDKVKTVFACGVGVGLIANLLNKPEVVEDEKFLISMCQPRQSNKVSSNQDNGEDLINQCYKKQYIPSCEKITNLLIKGKETKELYKHFYRLCEKHKNSYGCVGLYGLDKRSKDSLALLEKSCFYDGAYGCDLLIPKLKTEPQEIEFLKKLILNCDGRKSKKHCFYIGRFLFQKKKLDSALEYFSKSCELNEGKACNRQASIMLLDLKQTFSKVHKDLYIKTCELGETLGCLNLGIYLKERGPLYDISLAKKYSGRGCRLGGELSCITYYSLMLREGDDQFLGKLKSLCDKDNMLSCKEVGIYYFKELNKLSQNEVNSESDYESIRKNAVRYATKICRNDGDKNFCDLATKFSDSNYRSTSSVLIDMMEFDK